MPNERTWVTPLPPHLLDYWPRTTDGGWGELSVEVLGDLVAHPTEISAGTLQIPADALGEVSRQAVRTWLERAAPDHWLRIHEFCVRGRAGLVLFDWLDGEESRVLWLELMGLTR